MPQGNPKPGEFYRHFKKKQYQVVAIAEHSETGERLVIYQALYGDFKIYARPYEMFISEADHDKYPDVRQKYRFEHLERIAASGGPAEQPDSVPRQDEVSQTDAPQQEGIPRQDSESIPAQEKRSGISVDEVPEAAAPELIRFMDADSFSDKFAVFTQLKPVMTDKLLDELAVVCDLVIPEGNLSERYEQMKKCLLTRMKYERERDWDR